MSEMFKLNPFFSEKVWGYEKWNLSTHKNGCSVVDNSDVNLYDYLKKKIFEEYSQISQFSKCH